MSLLSHDQYTHITKILNHMSDGPRTKTDLMYESRFNHKQIDFYLDLLMQKQVIEKAKGLTHAGQKRDLYSLTKKGREVLKILLKLKELLE